MAPRSQSLGDPLALGEDSQLLHVHSEMADILSAHYFAASSRPVAVAFPDDPPVRPMRLTTRSKKPKFSAF